MLFIAALLIAPSLLLLVKGRSNAAVGSIIASVIVVFFFHWFYMPNLNTPFGWVAYLWAAVFGCSIATLCALIGDLSDAFALPIIIGSTLFGALVIVAIFPGWLVPLSNMKTVANSGQFAVMHSEVPSINLSELNIVPRSGYLLGSTPRPRPHHHRRRRPRRRRHPRRGCHRARPLRHRHPWASPYGQACPWP